MDKMSNTSKVVAAAVVIAVIIVLVLVHGSLTNQSQTPGGTTNTSSTATAENSAVTTTAANTTSAGGANGNTLPPGTAPNGAGSNRPAPPVVIHLITPVTNDQWVIGVTNPISWDNAGNITGEIDLLNGQTGAFIGVILSQTGPDQTSYAWDTREYSLSRYSPLKKEVVPGTYKIRLSFDGNNLPSIISPAFTISN